MSFLRDRLHYIPLRFCDHNEYDEITDAEILRNRIIPNSGITISSRNGNVNKIYLSNKFMTHVE